MSSIKAELIEYINNLPEYKLIALRPMLEMISTDEIALIEKINFDDLDEDEKQAILQAREEYERGETVDHSDIDWS